MCISPERCRNRSRAKERLTITELLVSPRRCLTRICAASELRRRAAALMVARGIRTGKAEEASTKQEAGLLFYWHFYNQHLNNYRLLSSFFFGILSLAERHALGGGSLTSLDRSSLSPPGKKRFLVKPRWQRFPQGSSVPQRAAAWHRLLLLSTAALQQVLRYAWWVAAAALGNRCRCF